MKNNNNFSFSTAAFIKSTAPRVAATFAALLFFSLNSTLAQSIRLAWNSYGHDAQHDAIVPVASQPLDRILWQTPVDLNPQYNSNGGLDIHYGSPLVTRVD